MLKHISEYKDKLAKSLIQYMESPVTERYYGAIDGMVECWEKIDELEHLLTDRKIFSMEDAREWCEHMCNDDGTSGGHWTLEETLMYKNAGTDAEWYATMNMIYSDYCHVAKKYNVDNAEFYADMTKCFIHDKDAPADKVGRYYCMVRK